MSLKKCFFPCSLFPFPWRRCALRLINALLAPAKDWYVLVSSHLDGPSSLPASQVLDLVHYTMDPSLAAVHVRLCDSYSLLSANLGPDLRPIPKIRSQALSPAFIDDWKPTMEKEIHGCLKHKCFEPVPLTAYIRLLPGQRLFSRKRTGRAKARFVIGGHRQRLGTDYFEFQNYCAVLASRDNRVLLALAAAQGWHIYQRMLNQHSFMKFWMMSPFTFAPPALYPCPTDHFIKL